MPQRHDIPATGVVQWHVPTVDTGTSPKYIMDEKGEKKSVVLSISDFEELIYDMEDLAAIAERRDEPTISHDELIRELREDGLI